jgi:conjugal transfer pilus assembly protein TraK
VNRLRSVLYLLAALTTICAHSQTPPTSTSQIPVEAVDGVALPGIPPAILRNASPQGALQPGTALQPAGVQPRTADAIDVPGGLKSESANRELTVQPGTTDIVRIARGYLNHIVTPFADPKLISANTIEVKKEGASLYVATAAQEPVGVYILSNDPADPRSISLTLVPSRIPPTTLTLKWPTASSQAASPEMARRWEESSPYEESLLKLVEDIAVGAVPDGYSLSAPQDRLPCALPGLEYVTGQRLAGSHFTAFVLKVTNVGRIPIELERHAGCNVPGVALVAPWPSAYLQPRASTELYVVVANEFLEPRAHEQIRPSLLTSSVPGSR